MRIRPPAKIRRAVSEIDETDRGSILVVATTALGDAVCVTPLIESLRAALPGARIGLFVREEFAPLFSADRDVQSPKLQTQEIPGRDFLQSAKGAARRLTEVIDYPGKFRRMGEAIRRIRAGGYRTALLCNMNDPDVVPLLLWGGVRAFLRRRNRTTIFREFLANPGDEALPPAHAVRGALELGERIGVRAATERVSLRLSAEAGKQADEILKETPLPASPTGGRVGEEFYLGLHPGSFFKFKQWDVASYAEICRWMAGRGRVILTGSARERGLCERIIREAGGQGCPAPNASVSENSRRKFSPLRVGGVPALNLAGRTPIDVAAALVGKMKVFVSPDTGLAHVAFALGTPTVTLYFAEARELEMNRPLHDPEKHRTLLKPSSPSAVIAECEKLLPAKSP
ncbi:glycosyltransferase family 9 protein [bacterium]|nr:glycosyltransferase family 9 protein [bacterium]